MYAATDGDGELGVRRDVVAVDVPVAAALVAVDDQ
jgi:hypothetical protein